MVGKFNVLASWVFFVTNPQILLLWIKWQTKCMIIVFIRVNLSVCYENDSLINFKALDLSFHNCKRSKGGWYWGKGGGGRASEWYWGAGVILYCLIGWYNSITTVFIEVWWSFFMCILVLLINYVHSEKGLKRPNQKLNVKLFNVLFQWSPQIFFEVLIT